EGSLAPSGRPSCGRAGARGVLLSFGRCRHSISALRLVALRLLGLAEAPLEGRLALVVPVVIVVGDPVPAPVAGVARPAVLIHLLAVALPAEIPVPRVLREEHRPECPTQWAVILPLGINLRQHVGHEIAERGEGLAKPAVCDGFTSELLLLCDVGEHLAV